MTGLSRNGWRFAGCATAAIGLIFAAPAMSIGIALARECGAA